MKIDNGGLGLGKCYGVLSRDEHAPPTDVADLAPERKRDGNGQGQHERHENDPTTSPQHAQRAHSAAPPYGRRPGTAPDGDRAHSSRSRVFCATWGASSAVAAKSLGMANGWKVSPSANVVRAQ